MRTQQELERLQAKYIGTGHPDTPSWEWKTNIHRDTSASIVGHPPMLAYVALAQNEPMARVRAKLIRVCIINRISLSNEERIATYPLENDPTLRGSSRTGR